MLAQAAATTAMPSREETSTRQPSEAPAVSAAESQLRQADARREAGSISHSLEGIETSGNVPPQSSMDIPQQSIEVSEPFIVQLLGGICS